MIAQLTEQMGTDQDALIFVLVEQLSGRKVLPEVWSMPSPLRLPLRPTRRAAEAPPVALRRRRQWLKAYTTMLTPIAYATFE